MSSTNASSFAAPAYTAANEIEGPAGDEFVGHPMIVPAEADETITSTLDAALDHFAPVNRHLRALTNLAKVPETAHTIYLLLSQISADVMITNGRAKDFECPGCQVSSYVKHGLLEPGDEAALMAAQTRASRHAFRFASPATEDELAMLHHEPEALVRAAYALARDLVA